MSKRVSDVSKRVLVMSKRDSGAPSREGDATGADARVALASYCE